MSNIPNPRINYDSENAGSHGYFHCPECKNDFYSGGEALHKDGCSLAASGYQDCIYNFGDKEVNRIQSGFNSFGFSWLHGAWTELKILRDFGTVVNYQEEFEKYKSKLLEVKSPEKAQEDYEALSQFWNAQK